MAEAKDPGKRKGISGRPEDLADLVENAGGDTPIAQVADVGLRTPGTEVSGSLIQKKTEDESGPFPGVKR